MRRFMKKYTVQCRQWWIQERKILALSLVGGIAITAIWVGVMATKAYSETIQENIAGQVVRFHVVANSDSREDQRLKLQVRDAVLQDLQPLMTQTKNKKESEQLLEERLKQVKETAESVVRSQGYEYPVSVSLEWELFPVRVYGDLTFPAGYYQGLKIQLGQAEGQNWWCVMYPPLCFVDASCEEVSEETKDTLRSALTQEEYGIITASAEEKGIPEIKFKIVEWWQEKMHQGETYAVRP